MDAPVINTCFPRTISSSNVSKGKTHAATASATSSTMAETTLNETISVPVKQFVALVPGILGVHQVSQRLRLPLRDTLKSHNQLAGFLKHLNQALGGSRSITLHDPDHKLGAFPARGF
mmetsp:Transcript_7824/g.14376  ORF Transcript_7824/g.14376 Transcript_7824/m.14376 type:complete len:118 (-) Transcript_7824:17-370(-)